jgi:hypothetical protein
MKTKPKQEPGHDSSWRWSHWRPDEPVDGAKLPLDAHAESVAQGTPPDVAFKLVSEIRNALVSLTCSAPPESVAQSIERLLALAVAMESVVQGRAAERRMCHGCGARIRPEQILAKDERWDTNGTRCTSCVDKEDLRAAYARGFDDGLDAADEALHNAVTKSNLRQSNRRE